MSEQQILKICSLVHYKSLDDWAMESKFVTRYYIFTLSKREVIKLCGVWTNVDLETDSCNCGHPRSDHQHLIERDRRYPCQKCVCRDFKR